MLMLPVKSACCANADSTIVVYVATSETSRPSENVARNCCVSGSNLTETEPDGCGCALGAEVCDSVGVVGVLAQVITVSAETRTTKPTSRIRIGDLLGDGGTLFRAR